VEDDAIGGGECDSRELRIADLRGKLGEVVERRIGRGVEDLESLQGIQTQAFAAKSFAFFQSYVNGNLPMV
jgi:hypothetical protein